MALLCNEGRTGIGNTKVHRMVNQGGSGSVQKTQNSGLLEVSGIFRFTELYSSLYKTIQDYSEEEQSG